MSEREIITTRTREPISAEARQAFERINLHLGGCNMAAALDALALSAGVLLEYARQLEARAGAEVELEALLADFTAAVRSHALANRGAEYGKPGAA